MSIHRPTREGRFQRLQLPFYGNVALGNCTQWRVAAHFVTATRLLVSIEGHGSYTFDNFVAAQYAAEKLGIMLGDAGNVADWINDQLEEMPEIRQGRYSPDLCANP